MRARARHTPACDASAAASITLTPPTRTFDGRLTVDVGGRDVELIEVR